jgi:hypothetical protein
MPIGNTETFRVSIGAMRLFDNDNSLDFQRGFVIMEQEISSRVEPTEEQKPGVNHYLAWSVRVVSTPNQK